MNTSTHFRTAKIKKFIEKLEQRKKIMESMKMSETSIRIKELDYVIAELEEDFGLKEGNTKK